MSIPIKLVIERFQITREVGQPRDVCKINLPLDFCVYQRNRDVNIDAENRL